MIDYSPEAVATRLRQVSEARELGLSLTRAGASRVRDSRTKSAGVQADPSPDERTSRAIDIEPDDSLQR